LREFKDLISELFLWAVIENNRQLPQAGFVTFVQSQLMEFKR